MDYHVETTDNWHTTVHVQIPAKEAKPKYDQILNSFKNNAKIEGFRKGKVPTSLIKKMYGDEIQHQAFQTDIDNAWKTALDEHDFKVLDEPRITDMTFDEKKGFSFQIEFDVYPEFEVKDYTDLPLEYTVYEITDEDIDKAVEKLRQRNAMMYTVDGEAQEGHHVVADLQELDQGGTPIIGHKFENQQLWLKPEDKELTPQLLGAKPEEERRLSLTINNPDADEPETAESEEHLFQVKVNEIKERRLPELDDEFAKDIGDFETLEQLRDQVRKELETQASESNQAEFENVITDEMIKRNHINVPVSVLDRYLNNLVEMEKKRDKNTDKAYIREQYKDFAERNIKWHYIMQQLIDQENIAVDDSEVEAKIQEIGDTDAERAEKIKADDEEKDKIKDDLLFKKVFDFLAEKGNITENKRPWYLEKDKDADELSD